MRCDVYVRYVFKNDTNGGQDVSSVRWILAVSSCLWLECQFVFLRGPYVTQCAEMTRGIYSPGKACMCLTIVWSWYSYLDLRATADERTDLGV